MITFSRLARTKQYARGKERLRLRITSAMQIVAERETPTRQWTRVAVFFALPRSKVLLANAFSVGGKGEKFTNEI